MNIYTSDKPFLLEQGAYLSNLEIGYKTYGKLNDAADNVVWICHALTANADVINWWPGLIEKGSAIDMEKYFIVCANILGSCYGSTGPNSIDKNTGQPYYSSFPEITIRDMVKAHQILCEELNIKKIHLLVGGSMGGYQVMEWALMEPEKINKLFLLTTSAKESAWGIAVHTTQRLAISADSSWGSPNEDAGKNGMKAARGMGIIMYRNYETMLRTQSDNDNEKYNNFKAESYIKYQGEKLASRFSAYSYWVLINAMDSHNVARGRNKSIKEMLATINHPTLILGIYSDLLCPISEQEYLADNMPNATFVKIDSPYGHDGFLVEVKKINEALIDWGL